jgi:hypothetical protein
MISEGAGSLGTFLSDCYTTGFATYKYNFTSFTSIHKLYWTVIFPKSNALQGKERFRNSEKGSSINDVTRNWTIFVLPL